MLFRSMYSGGTILLAFLYSLGGRKLKSLQTGMNNSALILTTAAIIEHAYSDTKRKGFFDIEILPAIYLLKSYFNQHFLMPMANRKAEHLTSTIKVTVTIHLFAMMDSQEI